MYYARVKCKHSVVEQADQRTRPMHSAERYDNPQETRYLNISLQISRPIAFQYSVSECELYFAARKMYEPSRKKHAQSQTGFIGQLITINF